MPFYDYKCTQCKDIEEDVLAHHEAEVSECMKCGGESRRLIAGTFFVRGYGITLDNTAAANNKVTDVPCKEYKDNQ